ncbi:patatin [[Haemophilus] ducreyi]|uniref:PNPLA domain-containing protein n=3 Tax=Haemophilus ducreyi TaxID=730 RepID=Q7VPK2_HAEDU|nr:patatin-like phospholipase family protein [[Haemophilus] ducreyi]AAP95078.1 hypothetical protein HD_0066 [[Haemophilus] ducreyi 35000HP]AKO30261.1 patatin [[Haemophilus] ducreyi]AKO31694.1 patatin [[Haemophilus] ducreyi]AKO33147.1 patatin [[Haemophilus] ducreyi]AKO34596.1 patatin [[Haemophilus] ducreyi]
MKLPQTLSLKKCVAYLAITMLSACHLVNYTPVQTIKHITPNEGYRLHHAMLNSSDDGNLIILMFSGGGARAASLGYGVLEELKKTKVKSTSRGKSLLDQIDIVYGVSGGSVLASYFALEGRDTIPKFEENFLKNNFQEAVINNIFSFSNLKRLLSPQFGRGELLQEQFNVALYKGRTFNDLVKERKGPFAVISATDMNAGQKITFIQDMFDGLCLNLNDLEIARAVAASSSVPLIFTPLTLNNNGGHCSFKIPKEYIVHKKTQGNGLKTQTVEEVEHTLSAYQNSEERPFIHLVDGGLTDNIGLASLLEKSEVTGMEQIYKQIQKTNLHNIIVINVNAQNQVMNDIDKSPNIPSLKNVFNTIVNIPINNTTQLTLRRFREFTDAWNKQIEKTTGKKITIHFVSLNMKDLPEGQLKQDVLNIGTSFYLPSDDVNKLRRAAAILLKQSPEYQKALQSLQ